MDCVTCGSHVLLPGPQQVIAAGIWIIERAAYVALLLTVFTLTWNAFAKRRIDLRVALVVGGGYLVGWITSWT